jgi:hypothetical protein
LQRARDRSRVLAGERDAQAVGRAAGMAREQHALDRRLALGERRLERAPAFGVARRFAAQRALLGAERREAAIRLGDGALGGAQRVARFLARFFLFLELLVQRVDLCPQRLQVCFFCGGKGIEGEEEKRDDRDLSQAFAFPWLATAAVRCATSAGSPR